MRDLRDSFVTHTKVAHLTITGYPKTRTVMMSAQQQLPVQPTQQQENGTRPGHPSRRDNHSISSNHSRGSSRQQRTPVESAVTRLLVAIKQLLESLTQWSRLEITENQVSDVYVRLGNDFNMAVAAFGQYNIEMSELHNVPDDLREVLERCLSEDATPENLEVYLPDVRKIITALLQGLRNKQSIYSRVISDRRSRISDSHHTRSDSSSSRYQTARSSRTESSQAGPSRSSTRSSTSETVASRNSIPDGQVRRRGTSSRRRDVPSTVEENPPVPLVEGKHFVGGFVKPHTEPREDVRTPEPDTTASTILDSIQAPPSPSEEVTPISGPPLSHIEHHHDNPRDVEEEGADRTLTPPRPPSAQVLQPPVPPTVKRYSLTDRAVPTFIVDQPSPTLSEDPPINDRSSSPPIDAVQAPVVANSLAALKKSDTLERRASKRFSTYNIQKMSLSGRHGSIRNANRRSIAVDPSQLTNDELDRIVETDESPSNEQSDFPKSRDSSQSSARNRVMTPAEESLPPLPPVPEEAPTETIQPVPDNSRHPDTVGASEQLPIDQAHSRSSRSSSLVATMTVFLQVGRVVKKTVIEPGLTFSTLRVLFVDKFSYSPGKDNFPAIYIRDPSSGIQYELEDVDEVKSGCLLSLNIEPLDQIKQHIDAQMSSLNQELKELRSLVITSRQSAPTSTSPVALIEESPMAPRPSEKQFQRVARRLSRIISQDEPPPQLPNMMPQWTGQPLAPQMTGASVLSDSSGRIVTDLKTQFDEVQNLRRDLGIVKQVYTTFMSQTKESLTSLREKTQSVKQVAFTKVGGSRTYINSGKAQLDSRSQNVLTKVEDLQDMVETMKDDVLKRNISPKGGIMKTVHKDITDVATELDNLKEYIQTNKPVWKRTWEEELQNIVEEQQFLSHQEELLGDLLEDHKALTDVFGHVEKIISIKGFGPSKGKIFRPPLVEEGSSGIKDVHLEIRTSAFDRERRLKAIMVSEKTREMEKSLREGFKVDVQNFGGVERLKMTGGIEEAERVSQKRRENTLRAMFSSSATTSPGISVSSSLDPGEIADDDS